MKFSATVIAGLVASAAAASLRSNRRTTMDGTSTNPTPAPSSNDKKYMPPASETYQCSAQTECGAHADRYYELIAAYDKFFIENYPVGNFASSDATGAYMRLRSVTGGEGFKDREKATDGPLGPTLKVKPGQTMSILLRNNLQPGTPPSTLGDGETSASVDKEAYLQQLNRSNEEGAMYAMQSYGFDFVGPTPTSVDNITVPNPENIPFDFDSLNLHLHGMVVTPHLFFPQGTSNSSADWISVGPGECYCYNFYIPTTHPTGTYWWHTHRHGSTAIWTWSQVAGLIEVEGSFKKELEAQGVVKQQDFVVTDPHLTYSDIETNTYVINTFLGNQNGVNLQSNATYCVNGAYQPTIHLKANETTWLRFLTATTENLVNFQIFDTQDGSIFPVWEAASDGINYREPVQRKQYVQGGGMRQDILLQFPKEGLYEVWTKDLDDIQFFGHGPSSQLLATFNVSGTAVESPVDIESLRFTLPCANDYNISASSITERRTVYFDVGGDVTTVPFPQFTINSRAFDLDYIYGGEFVLDGHAEEWTIVSTSNATHPFHIHVLPFQVKSAVSANSDISPMMKYETEVVPANVWRDTVVLPPYGIVKVWIQFQPAPEVDLSGKSVFHCHFLAHEDTGMITAIKWNDPEVPDDCVNPLKKS